MEKRKRGRPRGQVKTGGRQKGVQNRFTRDLRQMVLEAFHLAGGTAYLVKQAHDQPRGFLSLLGRLIPQQDVAPQADPVQIALHVRNFIDAANSTIPPPLTAPEK